MPSVDAVIIGGGPAGLMAAGALARRGLKVECIDPAPGRPSPQSLHVHHVAADSWAGVTTYLPGLTARLQALGRSPDRADVDRCLADRLPRGVTLRRAGFRSARRHAAAWRVTLDTKETVSAPILIDASGRYRRSLRAVARHLGQPVPIDEGPASGCYRSCRIAADGTLWEADTFRFSSPGGRTGVLGQRCGDGHWRLTLVTHDGGPDAPWPTLLTLLPRAIRDPLAAMEPPRRWHRHGAQKAGLLALDRTPAVEGWLPLGDALLTTAPYQGQGITNALRQVQALDRGAGSSGDVLDWQAAVFAVARRDWFRATLGDVLRQCSRPRKPVAAHSETL
ncbi:MAG: lycopene cyclase family protein [Xanthomonadales bacterium]|nr:lycopene cyclase family protein [Xanthomonadales bacterium]